MYLESWITLLRYKVSLWGVNFCSLLSMTSSFIPSQVCFIFFVLLKKQFVVDEIAVFLYLLNKRDLFHGVFAIIYFLYSLSWTFIGKIMPLVIQGFILRLASLLDNILTRAMISRISFRVLRNRSISWSGHVMLPKILSRSKRLSTSKNSFSLKLRKDLPNWGVFVFSVQLVLGSQIW